MLPEDRTGSDWLIKTRNPCVSTRGYSDATVDQKPMNRALDYLPAVDQTAARKDLSPKEVISDRKTIWEKHSHVVRGR
jgi:hypothetical protein